MPPQTLRPQPVQLLPCSHPSHTTPLPLPSLLLCLSPRPSQTPRISLFSCFGIPILHTQPQRQHAPPPTLLPVSPHPLSQPSSFRPSQTLRINLFSCFNILRPAVKAMMRQKGGGSIAFCSSAVARHGVPNHEAIAAAKAGVQGGWGRVCMFKQHKRVYVWDLSLNLLAIASTVVLRPTVRLVTAHCSSSCALAAQLDAINWQPPINCINCHQPPGLMLSAAATYAPKGIRVNCVAPGLTRTPLAERITSNAAVGSGGVWCFCATP